MEKPPAKAEPDRPPALTALASLEMSNGPFAVTSVACFLSPACFLLAREYFGKQTAYSTSLANAEAGISFSSGSGSLGMQRCYACFVNLSEADT